MKPTSLLLLATLLTACGQNNAPEKQTPVAAAPTRPTTPDEVRISPAQAQAAGLELGGFTWKNLAADVQANGVVDVPPQNRASISAVMGGYVQSVAVLPGQQVRRGAVLAVLRHPDYLKLQQEYLQSRARVTFLQQELKRQQTLDAEDVGAKRKLQQAQSDYASEQANLQSTAGQLRLLGISPERLNQGRISPTVTLTAPIGGNVAMVHINPGQYVNPQDVLVELVDPSHMHLELQVFERDVNQVRNGQPVLFRVPSQQRGPEMTASVYLVGKSFDPEKRTVNVHAHLEPERTDLIPGQYVAAAIQTGAARQRTLPEDAIVQAGEFSYIFTQSAPGAFRRVKVATGTTENGDVALRLLEPLPDSTHVVRRGAYFLDAELKKGQDADE
ncbi:efflux RND transporter periplasmic adaptor subunit [Hymenobacter endophyticus]|uniref:Efflux RND transporter periplasmic adaptor subunit n=1 Tax=Hymenobacter endophyticus TaxID=3076335 RepID=A0ABU3TK32_9BACT|nr:efflux RND transporter periplasmic adaptor subunit [Hymenobacter endophyticus]MDU0371734.1 efflux RND transporter periplasmic adaptor subunit [Hymenobacter endophyticus]